MQNLQAIERHCSLIIKGLTVFFYLEDTSLLMIGFEMFGMN